MNASAPAICVGLPRLRRLNFLGFLRVPVQADSLACQQASQRNGHQAGTPARRQPQRMNQRIPGLRALALGLLAALLLPLLARAGDGKAKAPEFAYADYAGVDFEGRAEAFRLAEEGSWALARDAFASALPKLTEPNESRWCSFLLADASWRAEVVPQGWQEKHAWLAEKQAKFSELQQAYDKDPGSRDELWIDVCKSLIEVKKRGAGWEYRPAQERADWLTILEHLADRIPSEKAANSLVDNLRKALQGLYSPNLFAGENTQYFPTWDKALVASHARYLGLLDKASRSDSLSPQDRAWCLLRRELLMDREHTSLEESRKRWADCLQAVKGTCWQASAEACLYMVSKALPPGVPGPVLQDTDIPAIVDGITRHKALLTANSNEERFLLSLLDQCNRFWTKPRFQLQANETLRPGDKARLVYGTCGYETLHWRLFSCSTENYLRLLNSGDSLLERDARLLSELGMLESGDIALPPVNTLRWSSGLIEPAANLKPGFYLFVYELSRGKEHSLRVQHLTVSDLDASLMWPHGRKPEFWLSHQTDHRPWTSKQIAVVSTQESSLPFRTKQPLRSDSQGHCEVTTPTVLTDKGQTRIVVEADGQPALIRTWVPHVRRRQLITGDLFVEKPLVKPGEDCGFKLILRERNGDGWETPQDHFSLTLNLGDTELLKVDPVTLDKLGGYAQRLHVPDDAKPGIIFLKLHKPGETPKDPACYYGQVTRVDHFIPPPITARMELVSSPDSLRPGNEIRIKARVNYLSGGGLSATQLGLQLSFMPLHHDKPWSNAERCLLWMKELKEHPLEAVTDANGFAQFRILIPAELEKSGALKATLLVNAPGIAPLFKRDEWQITQSGLSLEYPGGRAQWVRPGEEARLGLRLTDGAKRPVSRKLQATLVEKHWVVSWRAPDGTLQTSSTESEHAGQHGWERRSSDYQTIPIHNEEVTSDARGELTLRFTTPKAGLYEWLLKCDGLPVNLSTEPWAEKYPQAEVIVADENTRSLPLDPKFAQILSSQTAKSGQPLPVLVVKQEGAQEAFLNCSDEISTRTYRLPADRRIVTQTISVPGSRNPSFDLTLATPRCYLAPSMYHERKVEKEPSGDRATLRLMSPESKYRPSATLSLALEGREASGKPIPSGLAVAVEDDALNELMGETGNSDKESAFNSERPALEILHAFNTREPQRVLPAQLSDPRITGETDEDETIHLDAFEIAQPNPGAMAIPANRGYVASNSIAGSRLQESPQGFARLLHKTRLTNTFGIDEDKATKEGQSSPILIRRHFASSALWEPSLHTDSQGRLSVKVTLPDNLTRWRANAYAIADDGQRFALASTTFEAELPFQARLQQPRFLVDGDTATVLGTLVNRSATAAEAASRLTLAGPLNLINPEAEQNLPIPANGEARSRWTLHAAGTGTAKLELEARAGKETDGMETSLPVLEDGLPLELAATARLAPGERTSDFSLELPAPLDPARTSLELRLTPSLAGALVDALPYLIDYPYGCVEQTMSRFLPAVVVKSVLCRQGFDGTELEKRVLARNGGRTQAQGFASLDQVIAKSLDRLEGAATTNGGFGWWPGSPYADDWMSAYVKWGLEKASSAGVSIPEDTCERLTGYLVTAVGPEKDADAETQAWMLAALSQGELNETQSKTIKEAYSRLYTQRQSLSAWGRACLGLATARLGSEEQREVVLRNLENGVLRASADGYGETAQWGTGSGYWHAQEGALESTAMNLLALLELQPTHPLVAPAATWLALNRRSDRWGNTRGTAFAVLALSRYLESSRELASTVEFELQVNGCAPQRLQLGKASLLDGPSALPIPLSELRPGTNHFRLRRLSGEGCVYASVNASAWARGDAAKPSASLLEITRSYSEQRPVVSVAGSASRENLPVGTTAIVLQGSGLTAEVRLKVPHDTEYLMLEIPKPAGCEPLNPLSGWDAELVPANLADADAAKPRAFGSTRILYREEHDDRSVIFIDHISAGDWLIRVRLQAVFAGDFRILPVKAESMYVPEIRANTASRRLRINAE